FDRMVLLGGLLLGLGLLVVLARFLIGQDDAEGLLQELAGLQAVAAAVALGLHGGLAGRRHRHFDHAGHPGSSRRALSRSNRDIFWRDFSNAGNARLNRASQRARAVRSRSRRDRSLWSRRRCWDSGAGESAGAGPAGGGAQTLSRPPGSGAGCC